MQANPIQKQLLSPYPSYLEPNLEITVDGVRKRVQGRLHMYVGQARFVLVQPADALNLLGFVTLPFVERMDAAIKHRLITSADVISPKDPRTVHNQHPLRRWCEARLMLRHSTGYKLANQGEDTRSLAHYLGHRNLQSTARYTALAPDRFAKFCKH
jgi:hypothetical protein